MFAEIKPKRKWSDWAIIALVISVVGIFVSIILEASLKAALEGGGIVPSTGMTFLATCVVDFRYLFDQGLYAATVFFVGAKFIETRTSFSIGFDKMDASKVFMKGPDENNVVWVGHAYANSLEAEAVSGAIAERLKQSASA